MTARQRGVKKRRKTRSKHGETKGSFIIHGDLRISKAFQSERRSRLKNSQLLDNFLPHQVFSWCMHGAVLSWSHSYAEGVETFQLMLVASLLLLLFNRIKCLLFAKIFTCSRKRNANSFRLFCCWSFGCLLCYAS